MRSLYYKSSHKNTEAQKDIRAQQWRVVGELDDNGAKVKARPHTTVARARLTL